MNYPRRRPSLGLEAEGGVRIALYVPYGDRKHDAVGLEEAVHFVARSGAQEPPCLSDGELARTEFFQCQCLERATVQLSRIVSEEAGQIFQ